MIAKLAYLTTPSTSRYVLNILLEDGADLVQYEISQAHLANILITGTSLALREQSNSAFTSNRVSETTHTESANVGATGR